MTMVEGGDVRNKAVKEGGKFFPFYWSLQPIDTAVKEVSMVR